MASYYRIFCETDEKWEYEWRDTPPTICPTDAGHTVNDNSISEKKSKYSEDFTINTKLSKQEIDSDVYSEILSFTYPGSKKVGDLTKIEFTFSMNKNGKYKTGSSDFGYYMNIRDLTNNTTIYTSSQIGGTETISSLNIPCNTTCSTDGAIWCIQIKKAINAGNLHIRYIKFYFI